MSHFTFVTKTDGIGEIFRRDPARFMPLASAAQHMMRGPSELSEGEREIIAAFVSGLNSCQFCYRSHVAIAHAFGVDPLLIERLVEGDNLDAAPTRLRPILSLARVVTTKVGDISAADVAQVIAAGWTEQTAHDVICITALFSMFNRITRGHGVVGSKAYYAAEAKALGPEGGYMPS